MRPSPPTAGRNYTRPRRPPIDTKPSTVHALLQTRRPLCLAFDVPGREPVAPGPERSRSDPSSAFGRRGEDAPEKPTGGDGGRDQDQRAAVGRSERTGTPVELHRGVHDRPDHGWTG